MSYRVGKNAEFLLFAKYTDSIPINETMKILKTFDHMKNTRPFVRFKAVLFILGLLLILFRGNDARADATGSTDNAPPKSFAEMNSLNASKSGGGVASLDFHTDLHTGSFSYSIPIEIAPSRGSAMPTMGLSYNSGSGNGWCGVGWSLNLGYIQRDTRRGIPVKWGSTEPLTEYDDALGFSCSLGGSETRLVQIGSGQYRAQVESLFLQFEFSGNHWVVTSKDGSKYFFGQSVASRSINPGDGWSQTEKEGTFVWHLDAVIDSSGNKTEYTYAKNGGQLYPATILYNANINSPALASNCRIDFILEDRPDPIISLRTGFRVESRKRLKNIKCLVNGGLVRKYNLGYIASPSTGKSLLQSLQIVDGLEAQSLPPVEFEYSIQDQGFEPEVDWPGVWNQGKSESFWGGISQKLVAGSKMLQVSLQDVDGDGLPDRIMKDANTTVNHLLAQRNTGSGFFPTDGALQWGNLADPELAFPFANNSWAIEGYFTAKSTAFEDINGDHLPDRVKTSGDFTSFQVQLNNGISGSTAFDPNVQTWSGILSDTTDANGWRRSVSFPSGYGMISAFMDINGDTLPDRVMQPVTWGNARLLVQLNTGNGFGGILHWGPLEMESGLALTPTRNASMNWFTGDLQGAHAVSVSTIDINGDGLPDRLVTEDDNNAFTNLLVQFNNGYGFQPIEVWSPIHENIAREFEEGYASSVSWVLDCEIPEDFQEDIYSGSPGIIAVPDPKSGYGTIVRVQDINGDGLPDRIVRPPDPTRSKIGGTATWRVEINTGSGFAPPINWGPATTQGIVSNSYLGAIERTSYWLEEAANITMPGETYVDLLDINGDKLPDRVMRKYNAPYDKFIVQFAKGPFPDLLRKVKNGVGGSVEITYKPSTQYDNRDKDWTTDPWSDGAKSLLPFPVYTVHTETTHDGMGNSSQTTYSYKGGMYDHVEKEFRGFCRVEVAGPLGDKTVHWFHQSGGRNETAKGEYQDANSYAKKGTPFRVEKWGNETPAKLYSLTLNKVEEAQLYAGVHFPFVSKTVEFDYADGVNYRATAVSRQFDPATGNLLKQTNHGEIQLTGLAANNQSWTEIESHWTEIANDEVYTHVTYYGTGVTPPLTNPDIKDKPATYRATADSGGAQILKETLYDYFGSTGLLQRRRDRICAGTYAENTFTYDTYGNLQTQTDEVGVITQTTYDPETHTFPRQTVTGPFTTTTYYDPRSGLLAGSVQASGLVTTNLYDEFFRLKESRISSAPNIEADVWTVKYEYHLDGITGGVSGNSVRTLNNNALSGDPGHESWTYTDGLGRLIQSRVEADPQTGMTAPYRVTHTVYDERSQQKFVTLSAFEEGSTFTAASGVKPSTFTEYDPIGRAFRITPAENVTFASGQVQSHSPATPDSDSPMGPLTFGYSDGSDPWVKITTDEEGKVRKSYLDANDRTTRIVEVTDQGNYTTQYKHDLLGRLTNITDHANNSIEWAYDDLDRQVAMSDPHLGVWTWRRDTAGRIREQTDGRGNLVKSFYTNGSGQQDPLGRMLKKEVYDGTSTLTETVTYEYDSGTAGFTVYPGQLAKVTDGQGWQKFGYDVRGRTTKSERYLAVNTTTYTTQQTYDDADRVQTITYPGGAPIVQNTYDAGGMLKEVKRTDSSPVVYYTSKGYNELGQGRGSVLGNGAETTLDYFPTSKRLSRLHTFKGGTDLQNLTYQYTAANDVRSILDNVAAHAGNAAATISLATYDDLHRLKSIQRPGVAMVNYGYDPIGNMTLNEEAGAGTYNYGTARPQAVKSANGVNYTYDLCGNMALRGSQQLDYDAQNRLAKVSANGTTTATFGYADGGTRLWKQTSAGLQVWIGGLYELHNGLGRFHIYANGKRVCEIESATSTTHYSHGDHLGSSSVLTSAAGAETRHWEYSPYGRERFGTTQPFAISHRFTGQVLDEETGLYYYGARYYDPNLGRFIQPDSVISDLGNPQALNRYSYTLNNPLKYTDPTGHEGYWEGVGNMFLGYWDAGAGLVSGTIHMVAHPIQTVQGIGTAVAHPIATATAIKDATVTTWNSGTRGQGQVVGNVLLAVGTAVAPGAQAGNLGKVEQAANVGSKVERAAAAAAERVGATSESSLGEKMAEVVKAGPCFAAGTKILAPQEAKKIEDIHAGDIIYAYNFESSQVVTRRVLDTIRNFTYYWVDIEVSGETIHATRGHLFWVESKQQWKEAGLLRRGMTVRLQNGHIGSITMVAIRELQSPETTYNLAVEDDHNYFVSNCGVLVHNGGPEGYPISPQYPPATQVGETFQFNFDTSDKYKNSRAAGKTRALNEGYLKPGEIGDHINTVQSHPHLAAEPSNYTPRKSELDHRVNGHNGNYREPKSGPLRTKPGC